MNGYFQLLINEYGTSICLYPPTEDGESLRINEIMDFLQMKNVPYDPKVLNNAIAVLKEPVSIQLNPMTGYSEQEFFLTSVDIDKMVATIRFYPPTVGGNLMDKDEIIRTIKMNKIVYGIKEEVIDQFIKKREYCKDFVIAMGVLPVHGSDASIDYFFNTDVKVKPTLLEDGSVDFFNLNTLNHCKKGDILAHLKKEDPGSKGYNVFGEAVLPREVKKLSLKSGRNIILSEDKLTLTSEVNGHVSLINDTVFVSDVYEVENVDNSTGNIDFEGSIKINGNVCSNFTVKAKGNVEIKGIVEGAIVEAGGDIIIARGMNGMTKGILKADGNVISKFIENATVEAKGYVQTEAILHSKVMARTEVNVTGKKAFITGGVVRATNCVTVKTLGSNMGATTVIEVGMDPTVKAHHQQLQKDILEGQKKISSIQPVLQAVSQKIQQGIKISQEQIKYVQSLTGTVKETQRMIEEWSLEMNDLQELMSSSTNSYVIVTGEVFAGTKIAISDVSKVLKETSTHCRFIKSKGDVMITSI